MSLIKKKKKSSSSSKKTIMPGSIDRKYKYNSKKNTKYFSGSGKYFKFEEIIKKIKELIKDDEHYIAIGCDSQKSKKNKHIFVAAIAIVHENKGGIFFVKKIIDYGKKYTLIEKLYKEASISIEIAEELKDNDIPTDKIELHLDISAGGRSSAHIKGLVGMCMGYGFTNTKIKSNAWAASGLADKFSKRY